ncbi:MAG: peptidase prolyl oligopeptidase active site domain protein [Sphingomonas bacterium]|nr:peptidase prolyl oligopeptidase active site domain protein [Sphingomonas bacterium]
MFLRTSAAGAAMFLLCAAADPPMDDAARFGARESVGQVSLSPDGTKVAYITPSAGQGAALYVLGLQEGARQTRVLTASGKPERLARCNWVSNDRLICTAYGVVDDAGILLPFTRIIGADVTGGNIKMLSTRETAYTRGVQLGGGTVIDWLPDEDGTVLMARNHLADDRTGSHLGSTREGLGVDRLDTRTLATKPVEPADPEATEYISDGRGSIRIRGRRMRRSSELDTGVIHYSYRKPGSRTWENLSDYSALDGTGFDPYAVDHDKNVAYGLKKKDGRLAFYSVALDGSIKEMPVYSRPDVDVDRLIRIGRRNRVVGVSYATDKREPVYFDPEIQKLSASLSRALPDQPLARIVDSSVDEGKLLVFAGSDKDPGAYYVLDRKTGQMQTLLAARFELEGAKLATVKAIRYPAADGTLVPGYLTLPPGKESAKGLPAIVLPHGGPDARDEWGFDWLSQFYAARGFAVLQPNFRGSSGYGDEWFQQNGFRSWKVAIGDVVDAGRWLIAQGIADPARLGIVGWSYGGYAALQSAVVEPTLFKAVVAIAPVTDLAALKEESRGWSNFAVVQDYIGSGPHIREGSPAQNAARIKAPVLLFHGGLDRNVGIGESRLMADRLKDAGVKHELVTWDKLDHYLEDAAARTEMLRKSDGFLRTAMGIGGS